jgi:hypothetical protein
MMVEPGGRGGPNALQKPTLGAVRDNARQLKLKAESTGFGK